MFCSNCGKQIDDSAKFCNNCGAAINNATPVQEPVASALQPEAAQPVSQPESVQEPVEQDAPVSQPEAVEPVSQPEVAQPVYQSPVSQPAYQAPVQQTPVEPKGKAKKNAKVKTGKKFDKKKLLIVGAVAVALIIIIAVASGGGEEPGGSSEPGFKESLEGTSDFIDALNAGDAYAAYLLYDDATYNDSEKVEKYHEIAREKIDEIIKALVAYDYDNAVTTSENAVEDFLTDEYGDLVISEDFSLKDSLPYEDPKWDELDSAIDDALEYSDGVKHFVTREDNYDVANAIESMAEIKEESPFYDKAQSKMVEYSKAYLDETMKTVDSYIASGDFASAVELISGLRSEFENMGLDTTTIDKVLNAILTDYAETYVKKAEEAFNDKDARAAVGNMDAALQLCPDNAEYKAKRDEYALYLPYALYIEENMLVIEEVKGYITKEERKTANDNTEMQNCLEWAYDGDNYDVAVKVTYNLAGKYDYISGKMFLSEYDKSTTDRSKIKVYGDGALIYESPEITGGVLPQDVWCDVSGVQNIVVEYYAEGNKSWLGYGADGNISNFIAQKNFPEAPVE